MSKFVDPKYFAFHEDRAAKCDVFLDAHTFASGTWLVLLQSRLHRSARAMTHAIGSEFTPYVDLDIGLVACSTRARIRWCGGEAKKRKWKKKWKLTVPDDLMTKNALVWGALH